MKTQKQHFVDAVKNRQYQQVASLLYLIPELYLTRINNLSLFDYANTQDSKLKPILWGLCPNDKGLHNRLNLDSFTEYKTLGQSKSNVMTRYHLSEANNHLNSAVWDTAAKQLTILTGITPSLYSDNMLNRHQTHRVDKGLKYPIYINDEPTYAHLTFYLRVLGIPFDEVSVRSEYHLKLKPQSLRLLFNIFEGMPGVVNDLFNIKNMNQIEKIQAFDLVFNTQDYLQQVASRCQDNKRTVVDNLSKVIDSWFKHTGEEYLRSISHSLAQLDVVDSSFEQESSIEHFAKTLSLPTPDKIMEHGCHDIDPIRKEILFEICFMPKDFMQAYLKNLPNDQLSRQEFLESDLVKYQHALRIFVPEGIKRDYANQLGLNFIKQKSAGYYVAFEHMQDKASDLDSPSPIAMNRPSM